MILIGVIGAGLIGRERLQAIHKLATSGRPVDLVGVFDVNEDLRGKSAAEFGTKTFSSVDSLLAVEPDWVFVSLPHDVAIQTTERILNESGASVLLEKPMGRDLAEAHNLKSLGGSRLRIGFNYRFYEGIRKALQGRPQWQVRRIDFRGVHVGARLRARAREDMETQRGTCRWRLSHRPRSSLVGPLHTTCPRRLEGSWRHHVVWFLEHRN